MEIRLPAKIIAVEEDSVVLLCRLSKETERTILQTRRFDRKLIEGVVPLLENTFLYITITTKPGSMQIDFAPAHEMDHLFKEDGSCRHEVIPHFENLSTFFVKFENINYDSIIQRHRRIDAPGHVQEGRRE